MLNKKYLKLCLRQRKSMVVGIMANVGPGVMDRVESAGATRMRHVILPMNVILIMNVDYQENVKNIN